MIVQFEYDRRFMPVAPVAIVSVHGYDETYASIELNALIDSGADGTMIPIEVLESLNASYVDSVQMSGVTGASQVVDRYRVQLKIGDIVVNGIDAVAIDSSESGLLGRDVLNQLVVTLDGVSAETRISS